MSALRLLAAELVASAAAMLAVACWLAGAARRDLRLARAERAEARALAVELELVPRAVEDVIR